MIILSQHEMRKEIPRCKNLNVNICPISFSAKFLIHGKYSIKHRQEETGLRFIRELSELISQLWAEET